MRHGFKIGASLGLLATFGCAGTIYKYYTLDGLPDGCYKNGQLLGKLGSDGWPDLHLADCEPSSDLRVKCVLEFLSDHDRKETELLQCRQRLSDCQKSRATLFSSSR